MDAAGQINRQTSSTNINKQICLPASDVARGSTDRISLCTRSATYDSIAQPSTPSSQLRQSLLRFTSDSTKSGRCFNKSCTIRKELQEASARALLACL